MAVVKANAYGHGLERIARAAEEAGCPAVGVALPEEGAALREAGFHRRIVVLGLSLEEQAVLIAERGLEAAVARPEMLRALAEAGRRCGRRVRVHVKVDTGMTRAGIEPEATPAFCAEIAADAHLELAGVFTHFAAAEVPESVQAQWERFAPLVAALRGGAPFGGPLFHAANSAAALWFPPARLDWVRCGLVTYGVAPAAGQLPFPVEPVLSLHARLVQVREVPAGRAVGYGGTWVTPRPSRLALAPLGYADGLPWSLSNRGEALIRGRRVPIRGRICMDQVILDVTDLPPVAAGEEAVFIGRQGAEAIPVEEAARQAGTLSYEILTRLSERLPRVYRNEPDERPTASADAALAGRARIGGE